MARASVPCFFAEYSFKSRDSAEELLAAPMNLYFVMNLTISFGTV
jgi:hypothetical protein